jgi:hypothetical protein
MGCGDADEAASDGRGPFPLGAIGQVQGHRGGVGRETLSTTLAAPSLEIGPVAAIGTNGVRGPACLEVPLRSLGDVREFEGERWQRFEAERRILTIDRIILSLSRSIGAFWPRTQPNTQIPSKTRIRAPSPARPLRIWSTPREPPIVPPNSQRRLRVLP